MSRFYQYLIAFVFLFMLTSCATTPLSALNYLPGAVVETLASSVSLSLHTSDRSMGGSGYMLFRRPDQLHLVVLSPFGTTLMEAFALGDRATLVYPSLMTAYSGRFDELPDKGGLQGWRMMRWVMDADPSDNKLLSGTIERTGRAGFKEKVTYEHGLVISKISPDGDQVYYGKYTIINGVPLAAEVEIRNTRDDRVRLTLDEPEVNTPLDEAAFTARLDGFTVLPLSSIQGL